MHTFYAKNRKEWRKWLDKNHDNRKEIWLIYYKLATGIPTIKYNEALEEALCFGWIDSMEKGLDNERYAGRFSPRREKSNWSDRNRKIARRLVAQGFMTEAGQKTLPDDLDSEY